MFPSPRAEWGGWGGAGRTECAGALALGGRGRVRAAGAGQPGSPDVLGAHYQVFQDLRSWGTQTLAILGEAALKSFFRILESQLLMKGRHILHLTNSGGLHGKPYKLRNLK